MCKDPSMLGGERGSNVSNTVATRIRALGLALETSSSLSIP